MRFREARLPIPRGTDDWLGLGPRYKRSAQGRAYLRAHGQCRDSVHRRSLVKSFSVQYAPNSFPTIAIPTAEKLRDTIPTSRSSSYDLFLSLTDSFRMAMASGLDERHNKNGKMVQIRQHFRDTTFLLYPYFLSYSIFTPRIIILFSRCFCYRAAPYKR